jgi:small-conductance mechanosensitive channel
VTNVKQRFDEAGITIPFPQRSLSGRPAAADAVQTRELVGEETPAADD